MQTILSAILSSSLILASVTFSATALADVKPYSEAEFTALQNSGKSVVVEVHAPWCSTCRAQAPVVKALSESAPYQDVQVLHVDFDSQKEALKKFNVSKQSTLIGFKGNAETGRSTGATSKSAIETIFKQAL